MRRIRTCSPGTVLALLISVVVVVWVVASTAAPTAATGTGPELLVGGASLSNGLVQVPVYAWLPSTNAYIAFNLHLRWDSSVFTFSSANATGGVFDPGTSTGACVSNTAAYDSDGGGAIFGCTGYAGTTASYHLLATIILSPASSGCSALHLYTYGGADGGDDSTGAFTVNASDNTPETNAYRDGTANVNGQSCTPPHALAPAPVSGLNSPGATAKCGNDVDGNGRVNILDLSDAASHYNQAAIPPTPTSNFDVNADDIINILDLSQMAGTYESFTSGCVPGYPFYNAGPNWDGSLPGAPYYIQEYYFNTGAMGYASGSYGCTLFPSLDGWALKSPIFANTWLSMCDAAGRLAAYADDIGLYDYAHGIGWQNEVFMGPNDCMSFFSSVNNYIYAGAHTLYDLISVANSYAAQCGDHVTFVAAVDDEGYTGDCNPGSTSEAHCSGDDLTFFHDYPGAIGPAGAPPCSAGDENALSEAGVGEALPQIYVPSNTISLNSACHFDGLGPAPGSWPDPIPYGYAGIQSYPAGSPDNFFTSWQANIRWGLCHGQTPAFDFDWVHPGARG